MTATVQPVKSRAWIKWVVIGVLALVALPAGCTYWFVTKVTGVLRDSVPAKMALTQASAHPLVQAKLGSPLTAGGYASGDIKVNNADGSARISMPVSGPKGSGTLNLIATRAGGQWKLDVLSVKPDDGSVPINVIGGGIRS